MPGVIQASLSTLLCKDKEMHNNSVESLGLIYIVARQEIRGCYYAAFLKEKNKRQDLVIFFY